MAKTDKEFFDDRYTLFETDGWKDLVDELNLMSESINNVMHIEDEKALNYVKGQLSILNLIISMEDQTRLADEQSE